MTPATVQVIRALAVTLAVQAVVTMATLTVPVFAPAAAPDIGVAAANVGVFASLVYVGAMTSSLLGGSLVPRYGAIRVSQIGLGLSAVGMALVTTAAWPAVALAAVLLGLGLGPATPASSHVLARQTPQHLISFVFSIKQTGVPVGGMVAGALVPALVVAFGWRGAALAVGVICLACALAIQPTRRRFDTDLRGGRAAFRADVVAPLRLVLANRALRRLCIASFFFAAVQHAFSVFLVTYLVEGLGMSFVAAGLALSIGQAAGIGGRIAWGALADWTGRPHQVLRGLALAMTASCLGAAAFTASWPYAAVVAVAAVYGATALGWNGVFLAEVARIAPRDEASQATGGALFVTFFGVVATPPLFGALGALTGSYATGYALYGAIAGLCGLVLLRPVGDRR